MTFELPAGVDPDRLATLLWAGATDLVARLQGEQQPPPT
jgi:hypothetical protein